MSLIKRVLAGVLWVILWLPNYIWQSGKSAFQTEKPSPQREKVDIIERSNWLASQILVEPYELLDRMPSVLGEHFGGEWAIYCCSHYSAALLNISRLYPEEKSRCLERLEHIIEIVLDPALREYDTRTWWEDALDSLPGDNSHMTYLSILSWIITNYKLAGGSDKYDQTLDDCCEALNRRMLKSEDLNLLSFPGTPIFLPDMLFCIAALHNYSLLFEGRYADTVDKWLYKAKTEWRDKKTGLLVSMLPGASHWRGRRQLRGSYTALNCYCLTLIDKEFARDQYERMRYYFRKNRPFVGIKEYLNREPRFRLDVDAGPIIYGLSPSGTEWALGSATFFKDWEFRRKLLNTFEIGGITVRGIKKRHYLLGSIVLVGESVALAMKTNHEFTN